MVRLIKRYGSRKLYDTEESRYVSLEELGAWIREGQEIRVMDNESTDDVTAQTLTQVILEEGRRGSSLPPSEILHELIRRGGDLVSSGVDQLNQGVDRLIQAGIDRLGPVREVREETERLRNRLDELEAALARGVGGSPAESDAAGSGAELDPGATPGKPVAVDAVEAGAKPVAETTDEGKEN